MIPVKWVGPLRPGEQKRLRSEAQQVGGCRAGSWRLMQCLCLSRTRLGGVDGGTVWPFPPTGDLVRGSTRPCLFAKEGVGMWVQGGTSPASSCLVLGAWIQRILGELTYLSYELLGKTKAPWGHWLASQVGSRSQGF